MLLMIERGIIGGIATISHRHTKANNEYMATEFDPVKKSKLISYLDANKYEKCDIRKYRDISRYTKYGWAMSKQLPTSRLNG